MRSLISADDIIVIRDKKKILDKVSLRIFPHEFVTIIGPNGSGKSTLLRALLGVYKIDSGHLYREKNMKIGYIPQKLKIERTIPLSIFNFIALAKNAEKKQIDELLDMVGLEKKKHEQIHHLSGGELQRVMLVRALVNQPDLLILDEPAQNLDIAGQLEFYALLESFYTEKKLTIVMVSHDLYFVMASSTSVICLYHHICCAGAPKTISKNPEFIKLFGQDMADMMAYYNHTHDHRHKINEDD